MLNKNWQTEMISGDLEPTSSTAQVPTRRKSRTLVARDRWENQVSGYGAQGVDPVASTFFNYGASFSVQQLDALYKNWLARRIVEELPNSALLRGFEIKSKLDKEKNEIDPAGASTINDILEEWKTAIFVKQLGYQARLYGGAAKINFVDDGMPTGMPLNERMLRSLQRVVISGRFYCRPWKFYNDVNDLATFDTPWIYQIFRIGYYQSFPIYHVHHSRLSWMDGGYLPDHMKISTWGAGQSIVELVEEDLKAYGSSIQSLSGTIQDFFTKVLTLDNFEDLLEENSSELDYRIQQADAYRNIHRTTVIGQGEKYEKLATPITGLSDAIGLLMDAASAAAGMPKSQLFGHMTGTLGSSSGESDKANWHDKVETWQTERAQPVIEDDMKLACSIANVNFENLMVFWPPVREKGDKEEAEIRKTNAEAESLELNNEQKRRELDNA